VEFGGTPVLAALRTPAKGTGGLDEGKDDRSYKRDNPPEETGAFESVKNPEVGKREYSPNAEGYQKRDHLHVPCYANGKERCHGQIDSRAQEWPVIGQKKFDKPHDQRQLDEVYKVEHAPASP
jgi:hypothetical protein